MAVFDRKKLTMVKTERKTLKMLANHTRLVVNGQIVYRHILHPKISE